MSLSRLQDKTEEARQFRFTDRDFRLLVGLVHNKTGIALSDEKKNLIYGRLSKRLRQLQLESFSDYCLLLDNDQDPEFQNFLNAITTNHTKFFRESHHFVHMKNVLIPKLEEETPRGAKQHLRIWSAACSSGEEPYSIALTLMAYLKSFEKCDVRILATDLDSNVLKKGREARYSADQLSHIPQKLTARISGKPIVVSDDKMRMSDAVQRLINFKQLNLLSSWPIKIQFDAIMCRNVMIYFDTETKTTLVKRFDGHLKVGGFLYTGHAESLVGILDNYKMVGKTVYQKME